MDRDTWRDFALCRLVGPEKFYPEAGGAAACVDAQRICENCSVKGPCGDYATRNGEEHGVWGGMTEIDLRRTTNKQAARRAARRAANDAQKAAS